MSEQLNPKQKEAAQFKEGIDAKENPLREFWMSSLSNFHSVDRPVNKNIRTVIK
jgi:hypothetical protein